MGNIIAKDPAAEEKFEQLRLEIYQTHEKIIPEAFNSSFQEFDQEINQVNSLISPSERFRKESHKIGIPHIAGISLFENILLNTLLSSREKFLLLYKIILNKGYHLYIDILFSMPTRELLCADADPANLLIPLYTQILRHYPDKALAILENWAEGLERKGISAFLKFLKTITNLPVENKPLISHQALKIIFRLDETRGQELYKLHTDLGASNEDLLEYLAHWLPLCKMPANFLFAENAYFTLSVQPNLRYQTEIEAAIWLSLIGHDHRSGFNLFRLLLSNPANSDDKLLDFVWIWLHVLDREAKINQATQDIEATLPGTPISSSWFQIRMWSQRCLLQLSLASLPKQGSQSNFFRPCCSSSAPIMAEEMIVEKEITPYTVPRN